MIQKISEYCIRILQHGSCKKLPFHNLQHTIEVVTNVQHIGKKENINNDELQLVTIAAWFHDTGFSNRYKGHEDSSQKIASEFLLNAGFSRSLIGTICKCIEATKMPQLPTTKLAEILCDADIMHISTPHFFFKKLLLRREWEVFCSKKVTDLEWHLLNQIFLEKHHFWTDYGKEVLSLGKKENLNKVLQLIDYYND